MNLDREALAWAAGFYDGEGSTFTRKGRATRQPSMGISQKERTTLDRFHAAVGGLGVTYVFPKKTVPYAWQAQRFEHVQAVLALLWPWLSQPKRDQASRALSLYRMYRSVDRNFARAKTECLRGHPFDEANTYLVRTGGRRCRTCDQTRRLARTVREREARNS